MKAVSKRGAALAIVIVVSAAILILSAALVSAAAYNVGSSQNSMEGRQAYLDAKSAIEYGKAYVKKNPSCTDFSVLTDSTSGSGYKTGAKDAANHLAVYTSADRTIRATAKYKSSDRVKSLTYKFPALSGGYNGSIPFIQASLGKGDTSAFNGDLLNTSTLFSPIMADFKVRLQSSIDKFCAPQMYFMGLESGNCFVVTENGGVKLASDFIYFHGNIDFSKNTNGDNNALKLYRFHEITNEKGNSFGVVCFNNTTIVRRDGTTVKLNGYYVFEDGMDLSSDDVKNTDKLQPINEDDFIDLLKNERTTGTAFISAKNYIINNYKKMVSSEPVGANWTEGGNLANGKPSDQSGKIVCLYIKNCDNWHNILDGTYKADEIHLQYVRSSDFYFPALKTATFMADQISINTQTSDKELGTLGKSGTKPIIKSLGEAHCVLKSKSGKEDFYVTFPYETTVYCSEDKIYDIDPGSYHITDNIGLGEDDMAGIDLFTEAAETFFAETAPIEIGGQIGSGGTGGSDGGGYTNE